MNEPLIPIYVYETYIPYAPKRPTNEFFNPCSCVSYAKWKQGVLQSVYWGNAYQIKATSLIPYVGGLVLLNEGRWGHLAYIEEIHGDWLYVAESNYRPCQTGKRKISIYDSHIRGYR